MKKHKIKKAFTLTEVLVTLGVIGVIAAIIFPTMTMNVKTQVLDKSRLVFTQQFHEGLTKMRLDGMLSQEYSSSLEFANAMKNFFSIAKTCTQDKLKDCFPAKFKAEVAYNNNDKITKQYNTSTLRTSTDLDSNIGYNSDIVGIVLENGFRILLTYNTNCTGPAPFEKNTDVFTCIKYVVDTNGSKSPNTVYQDIVTNVQLFDLGFEVSISDNSVPWDTAKTYCENLPGGWRLPSVADLSKIAAIIYTNDACSDKNRTVANGEFEYGKDKPCNITTTYSSAAWKQLLGEREAAYYWIDKTSGANAYYRCFLKRGSTMESIEKNHNGIKVLCVK